MRTAQVQRTLVKSPPELWAELSDPAALARHLGELGEIRITRIEPEHKVEWIADRTSGTVMIKPSGWGTRVTLTATRELSGPPPSEPGMKDAPRAATDIRIAPAASGMPPMPPANSPQAPMPPATSPAAPAPASVAEHPAPAVSEPAAHAAAAAPAEDPVLDRPPAPSAPTSAAPPITREEGTELMSSHADAPAEARGRLFARVVSRLRRRHAEPAREDSQPPAALGAQDSNAPSFVPEPSQALLESAFSAATPMPAVPPTKPAPPIAPEPARPAAQSPAPPSEHEAAQAKAAQAKAAQPEAALPEAPELPTPAPVAQREDGTREGEDIETVLSSVLDSLGSAHHRPFSRA